MKKLFTAFLALVLAVALLPSCRNEEKVPEASGELTVVGRVISIEGNNFTLQLGELADGGAIGEKPNDENGAEPPEKPSEGGEESKTDGAPPEMPQGNGSMPFFVEGKETLVLDLSSASVEIEGRDGTSAGNASDIKVGDVLDIVKNESQAIFKVTVKRIPGADSQSMEKPGEQSESKSEGKPGEQSGGKSEGKPGSQSGSQPGKPGGGSKEVDQGTSANTIDKDGSYKDSVYTSTGKDENALRVDGAKVTLEGITVNKTAGASSNPENGDFYGMNAALLATNGANVTIKNIKVNSSAQNGNGIFSYGKGTVVSVSDSVIVTTADNSGGIQTTGGGTTNAYRLDVTTSGNSSAAIRSDRGGGTVKVDGGSYTSNGYNSPAVYSTAEITVKNAVLTATNSEALVIEGKNSIALESCTVSGNMSDTRGASSDINVHNVMIYQSMSGDADVGTSVFGMKGGKLISNNGDLFYITNTRCIMTLSGVQIENRERDGYFMLVSGNNASHGWGKAGANGANVEFTADSQSFGGDIAVDSISTLNMKLTNKSSFTGSINIIENAQKGAGVTDNATVTVESGSVWTLTGNCTLTKLINNGTINFNGYTITLADGSVIRK